jgi:hypothetical protein
MFQTDVVEIIKTNFICNNIFPENRAVYKIMWENMVEPDRLQMKIWSMLIACWIIKATNTHSGNVTLIASQRPHWLREGLSVLRNKHIAFPVDLASCLVTFGLPPFIVICQVTESLQCSLCNE